MNCPSSASHLSLFLPMDWELPTGVRAVCTMRAGGVSQAPFDSFNLGDHVHDAPDAVVQNRNLLQARLAGARPVFLKQLHGVDIAHLNAATPDGTVADACITQEPRVACTIMVADCLPVLFTDTAGQVVAAAHAGWRGLAAGVIETTIQAVCMQANLAPAQILVWLGPCIGPDMFEVGEDVHTVFTSETQFNPGEVQHCFKPHPMYAGKWLADLAGLARLRLQALGVVSISGNDGSYRWCTVSQASRFFSYRRDGVTGRFAACIWRD